MKAKYPLLTVSLLLALVCSSRAAPPGRAVLPPSLLLVTLDTTRADRLGCYGASGVSTPHVDALAKGGVRFARALSPVPLTLPAHASLMTGRVPRRHGVRDNALFRLDKEIPLLAERLRQGGYRTAAFVSSAVLDRQGGLDRGFQIYDDTVRVGDRRAFNYEERAASQTTDAVLSRLGDLEPPFFLWVHYFDPHLPYVPPEPYASRFKDRSYDGEIAFMDQEVGRLLAELKKRGGHLVVAVAGDHGEGLGEHGEAAHGVFVYQATQHVPLILGGPGVPAGKVIEETVGLIDVAPTLLELLGMPPIPNIDGRSLLPLLSGHRLPRADYEMETYFPRFAYGWAPLKGLVRWPLKYIESPRPEMYDLGTDARERAEMRDRRPTEAAALAQTIGQLTAGDRPAAPPSDPEWAEQVQRLEALGYVGGTGGTSAAQTTIDPKDGIAWLSDLDAGRRALQSGRPREGVAPLERLIARSPDNVPALLALGQCRLGTGEVERAVAVFRRAIAVNPDNHLVHFNLANGLAAKSLSDAAVKAEAVLAYEKTLLLNPRHAESYLNYGAFLTRDRRMEEVRSLFERARRAGVEDPEIETTLGLLEVARGNGTAARKAFERAVALNPGEARALEQLGRLAYAAKDPRSAEGYYARALAAAPSAALARTLGSIRLYDLSDRAGARAAFEEALALSAPGDPERGDIVEILGQLADDR